MKASALALLIVLTLPLSAIGLKVILAPKANAKLEAPVFAAAGPVLVHGHASRGDWWSWKCAAPHVVVDGGKCLVLAPTKPGSYDVELTVRSGGLTFSESTALTTVQVGGEPPSPPPVPPGPTPPVPPGPTPPVPPVPPPIPDGKFGLTKASYDAATNLVQSPAKVAEAKALAASFREIAGRIGGRSQDIQGVVEWAAATVQAFNKLGAARAVWEPAIQAVRKKIYAEMSMTAPLQDLVDASKAIADGLEAVK